jgi:hypothetical protein
MGRNYTWKHHAATKAASIANAQNSVANSTFVIDNVI